jgi:hypothetical protein
MRVLNPKNGTIQRLSKKYDTLIADRGMRLSAVDHAAVAAFNNQQRLTTKEQKRKFKHPAQ